MTQLGDELNNLRAMLEAVSERQDAFDSRLQMLENRVRTVEAIGSLWEKLEGRIQAIEDLPLAVSVASVVADDLAVWGNAAQNASW